MLCNSLKIGHYNKFYRLCTNIDTHCFLFMITLRYENGKFFKVKDCFFNLENFQQYEQ